MNRQLLPLLLIMCCLFLFPFVEKQLYDFKINLDVMLAKYQNNFYNVNRNEIMYLNKLLRSYFGMLENGIIVVIWAYILRP